MDITARITKKEWHTVIIIIAVTLLIVIAPYLYGYAITPQNKYLTGVHSINSADTYTYLSWIEQGRQGKLLFKNLYTPETQPNIIFHPLFLVLGQMAGLLSVSNIVIYHAARIIVTIFFIVTLYSFLRNFLEQQKHRIIALLLLLSSSGLGFILPLYSTDLWVTESITFLSIYESLLNVLSLILMIYVFSLTLKKFHEGNVAAIITGAAALNILVLIHPLDFALTTTIIGGYALYALVRQKNKFILYNFLYTLLFTFPSILWQAYVLIKNPAVAFWATQHLTLPSQPTHFMAGYGLLLAFAWVGIALILNQRMRRYAFIIIWLFISGLLIYFPLQYKFQRKFSEGLHIPITILATVGLTWWVDRISNKRVFKNISYALVIVLLAVTNIFIVHQDIKSFQSGGYPFYITQAEKQAIEWLGSNTSDQDIILSGTQLGNLIPGISGRTVYLGYPDFTISENEKYELANQVLTSQVIHGDPLKKFLKQNGITYLFVDNELRTLSKLSLETRKYLFLQYQNQDVKIYRFKKNNNEN